MDAVLATLQENYVRPDEANAAQSRVATHGSHRFIDKVHVRYVEKEKKHWAALENFNSQRIGVGQKFYRENERLLEGGIWAEVTVSHNDVDADDYAFFIAYLRPIQLSRFDLSRYIEGRAAFTRDEWLDVLLRSVGLEPSKLTHRMKFHFLARLAPLIEPNFNFIELGPRSTGKSYFYSEFSPYSTLVSGGQASTPTLFYHKQRGKVGLVGFWDTVAFDEVGNMKIRDADTIQIMKDFMANGRFSRGVEVIADASLAFVGNIDLSVEQVVNSTEHDLFQPLPPQFDLAVLDRFACCLPGWEMPKNGSDFLTSRYGFITDYLAEAFHHLFKHSNRYEEVNKRIRLGAAVEGRDEKGIKKTVCAFLKILHPGEAPTDAEFEEYVAYAVEGRRRIKEQMNKRKADDEYEKIGLSYFSASGEEVVVYCPESKNAIATQEPERRTLNEVEAQPKASKKAIKPVVVTPDANVAAVPVQSEPQATTPTLEEQHYTILWGDTGHTFDTIVGPFLTAGTKVTVEEPYVRLTHQIQNFVRLCETIVRGATIRQICLVTAFESQEQQREVEDKLADLKQSLLELDVQFDLTVNSNLHDREIRIDNGWTVKIGRGLDIYQKPDNWSSIGAFDLSQRKCMETKVDVFRA